MTSTLVPTDEQTTALDGFSSGLSMALDALAGTGKSSTLRMIGESAPGRLGQYLAFNSAIVREAARTFPANVDCRTAHSLAFRAVAPAYPTLRTRLDQGRMRGDQIARELGIDPQVVTYGAQRKVLQPSHLAGHVMRAVTRFCQSADPEPTRRHVAYIDGLDIPDPDGTRNWDNNNRIASYLEPFLAVAWADLTNPHGRLRFSHDCQPPGTLVRVIRRPGGTNRHTGESWETETVDIPIEQVRAGDRVMSYSMTTRRGYVRRAGRRVNAAGQRDFAGALITVGTESGRRSSYTPEHRCVARLDVELTEGNHVVYIARRGERYRIGRTTWRTRSQSNTLGIRRRGWLQKADGIWVLSVHADEQEAALAEALTAHRWDIPTWQFQSKNETMPLGRFWEKIGDNRSAAAACLAAHGRDIRFPLFDIETGWRNARRPLVLRACNLLDGMKVLDVDAMTRGAYNSLPANDGSGGWTPITINSSWYEGPVYNLDIDVDHTYVADGIVTHNCYMKLYELSRPRLGVDFLLIDEAQDLSPVMLSIMEAQKDAQLVVVGDANQSVYSWRGSVNAMEIVDVPLRARLTQSFRFGDPVAEVANWCLGHLATELRVRGYKPVESRVCPVPSPRSVLCRTNAGAMDVLFTMQTQGRRPCLLGGGSQVASFARAAKQLMDTGSCGHPDLWCFDSWKQVVEYTETDPQGDELALMVKLVESYGVDVILEALDRMPDERAADVVIATAHAAKGREWESVRLHSDFRTPELSEGHAEEWRLLYVAVTRARLALDVSLCPAFAEFGKPAKPEEPALVGAGPTESAGKGLTDRHTLRRLAEAES